MFAVRAGPGSPEAVVSGLRLAYFGGAVVEIAGALIALGFIRSDALGQKPA